MIRILLIIRACCALDIASAVGVEEGQKTDCLDLAGKTTHNLVDNFGSDG